jgi:hypothetical protein
LGVNSTARSPPRAIKKRQKPIAKHNQPAKHGANGGPRIKTYGYDHVAKTELAPPAFVINTREAHGSESIAPKCQLAQELSLNHSTIHTLGRRTGRDLNMHAQETTFFFYVSNQSRPVGGRVLRNVESKISDQLPDSIKYV